MKTWRLVSGILSIILSVFVFFQSFAAGFLANIKNSGDLGGSAGLIVSICLLAGGITSIATKNRVTIGNKIALLLIFGFAAMIAFSNSALYKDLMVWGAWCAINALVSLIAARD